MVASSVATVVLVGSLLAAPALAAPIHSRASSSGKSSSGSSVKSDVLSGAASGAASAGVTQLIQGVEKLLRRDNTFGQKEDMSPSQLFDDPLNIEDIPQQRSPLDIVETIPTFDLPLATEDRRSLKDDLAGSAASGAANAAVTQLIQGVEKILRRDTTSIPGIVNLTPLFDLSPEGKVDSRSLKGDLAGSAASGAANAAVTQLIQGVEKILRRELIGIVNKTPTFDFPAGTEFGRRSPLDIVETIPTFDLSEDRRSLADLIGQLNLPLASEDVEARSLKGDLAGSAASGAANAAVTQLIQGVEKILRRELFGIVNKTPTFDFPAGTEFGRRSPLDIVETIPTFDFSEERRSLADIISQLNLPLTSEDVDARSLKGDLAGSAASGAANAAVTQLIQGVEKILRRSPLDITETIPTFDIPLESELDRRSNSLELPNGLNLKDLFARDMDLD